MKTLTPLIRTQLEAAAARAVVETLLMVIAHKQAGSEEILRRLAELTLKQVDQFELRHADDDVQPAARDALRTIIGDIFREAISKSWRG